MEKETELLSPPSPTNQRTVGSEKDDQLKIRLGAYGAGSATINGLDSKELANIEGAMHGHFWVTVSDRGRLRAIPSYKELPSPIEDEMMTPFWRSPIPSLETQLELFPIEPLPRGFALPSIIIQHLCGYHYTHERYLRTAENLQRWGFECLRSRRNASGRFHEMWVLSGLWAAQNELKEAVEGVSTRANDSGYEKRRLKAALDFLAHRSSFGTLDVTYQRMAMVIDD